MKQGATALAATMNSPPKTSERRLTFRNTPCVSCPYRCDVPAGLWDVIEYFKLLDYDEATGDQPTSTFLCHDADRDTVLCRGWWEVHGEELLAVQLLQGHGCVEMPENECAVPCFPSGFDAAAHGLSGLDDPGIAACRMYEKLKQRHPELVE